MTSLTVEQLRVLGSMNVDEPKSIDESILQNSVRIVSTHYRNKKRKITELKKAKLQIFKSAKASGTPIVWHEETVNSLVENPPVLSENQVAAIITFVNHYGKIQPTLYIFKDTEEVQKHLPTKMNYLSTDTVYMMVTNLIQSNLLEDSWYDFMKKKGTKWIPSGPQSFISLLDEEQFTNPVIELASKYNEVVSQLVDADCQVKMLKHLCFPKIRSN